MPGIHGYDISVVWTGNRGTGTSGYRVYSRDHEVSASSRSKTALVMPKPGTDLRQTANHKWWRDWTSPRLR